MKEMEQLNIILSIVCALTLLQAKASDRRYYGIDRSTTTIDPRIYLVNDTVHETNYSQEVDLVANGEFTTFILSANHSHVFVNSTNATLKNCTIKFSNLGYAFQVAALNEKIILWDRQTAEDSDKVIGTTLLLINPLHCNITSNIEVPVDLINGDQPPYKAQVLTYGSNDYFDIFYGGRTNCTPCRFKGNGTIVKMEHQLPKANARDASPYIVRPFRENDPNLGYLYVRSFYNGSLRTEMNVLDVNFTLQRQIYVDHVIDDVAIDQAHHDIVVCYKKEYQKYVQMIRNDGDKVWRMVPRSEVYCDVYNSFLDHQNDIKLSVPNDHHVGGVWLRVGKTGSLCVAVPHVSYNDKTSNYWFRFFLYNSLQRSDTGIHRPLGSDYGNFDNKDGYKLKVKAARQLRMFCD